jgi:hypothetical protein
MVKEIIRSQTQVSGAAMNVLVDTYNALTGKSIKKFENRAIAEQRVTMAIMSAVNESGHLGVPKGQAPQCLTAEERAAKAAAKGEPEVSPAAVEVPKAAPAAPAKAGKAKPGKPRRVINKLRATGTGKSKPQVDSVRGLVLKYVQSAPDQTATLAQLEAKFGEAARGCVLKLIEKDHLVEVA